VLGFTEAAGRQHIVLGNPRGHHEGTVDVLTSPGTWSPGGTASNPPVEPVPSNTGAMKTTTFKTYQQGFATSAWRGASFAWEPVGQPASGPRA
jgi:hypothetical protein